MWKFFIAAAVFVAGGMGLGLAFAGDGDGPLGVGDKPGVERTFETVPFHPAPAPARAEVAKKKKPKIEYFLTDPLPVPANGVQSATGVCPDKYTVIDGGFVTDGQIFADVLGPETTVSYIYAVRDFSGLPGEVIFTMICSKGNG